MILSLACPETPFRYIRLLFRAIGVALIVLFCTIVAQAQTTGDYRVLAASTTFNWTATANWQRYSGGTWGAVGASGYPGQTAGAGVVTIAPGKTITLDVSPAQSIGSLIMNGNSVVQTTGNTNFTLGVTSALNVNVMSALQATGTSTMVVNMANSGSVTVAGTYNTTGTATATLHFLGSGTFANTGTVSLSSVELDGVASAVTFGGSATTIVGACHINASNITMTLNNTMTNNATTFTIQGTPNFTLVGSGAMNLPAGGADFNVQSDNVSVGITMSITDGLAIYDGNNFDLNLTSGANISCARLRIAPNTGGITTANNMTVTIASGAALSVTGANGMRINENAVTVNDFTFNNAGTFSTTAITFSNTAARAIFNNTGTFTMSGDLTGAPAGATAATFTNNTNATLNLSSGSADIIDNDVILDFDATGNTVNYTRGGDQTIEIPQGSYHNLSLSTSGIKTLAAAIDMDGSVLIQNTAVFNTASNSITVGKNWTNTNSAADSFTQGTGTVTFDGNADTGAQIVVNTGHAGGSEFYNLTIDNAFTTSPQVTLSNKVIVDGTLKMVTGNISIGTDLQLGTGTTAGTVGTLDYDQTNLPWMYGGSFTRYFRGITIAPPSLAALFPMGSSSSIRPFYVYPTTAPATGGYLRVTHNNATTSSTLAPTVTDTGGPIVRQHQANWVATSGFVDAAARFSIYAGGRTGATGLGTIGNVNDLRLMRSNNVVGTHGTNATQSGVYLAQRNALTLTELASTFYIGSVNATNSPLPVELASFAADAKGSEVALSWSTASELNNSYFTVERSRDGTSFDDIGRVVGAGTSSLQKDYEFTDANPFVGRSFYRLAQTDYDGTTKRSALVRVDLRTGSLAFAVYPNPITPDAREIDAEIYYPESSQPTSLSIFDMQGKQLYFGPVSPRSTASSHVHITLADPLSSGLYVVKLNQGKYTLVQKIAVR